MSTQITNLKTNKKTKNISTHVNAKAIILFYSKIVFLHFTSKATIIGPKDNDDQHVKRTVSPHNTHTNLLTTDKLNNGGTLTA